MSQNKKSNIVEANEVSELKQKIWAVIDGKNCFMKKVTYLTAQRNIKKFPNSFVVTNQAASRLS